MLLIHRLNLTINRLAPRQPHMLSRCWLWTGALTPDGYGRTSADGQGLRAHRVMYELAVGPISSSKQLDHECNVRACVRPSHVRPMTSKENNARRAPYSVHNATKTHCPHGHEYIGANLHIRKSDGARICRTCRNQKSVAHRQRARSA